MRHTKRRWLDGWTKRQADKRRHAEAFAHAIKLSHLIIQLQGQLMAIRAAGGQVNDPTARIVRANTGTPPAELTVKLQTAFDEFNKLTDDEVH